MALGSVFWRSDSTKDILLRSAAICCDLLRSAAIWNRKSEGGLEMSPSELALFTEGSEFVGRHDLSWPLLKHLDLRSRFEEKAN